MCMACKETRDDSYSPVCELTFLQYRTSNETSQSTEDVSQADQKPASAGDPDSAEDDGKTTAEIAEVPEDESCTTEPDDAEEVATSGEVSQESTEQTSSRNILDGHLYAHSMILYQVTPKVESAVMPADQVEEKLGVMHDHIMALQSRMDQLEQLLRRALSILDVNAVAPTPQVDVSEDKA